MILNELPARNELILPGSSSISYLWTTRRPYRLPPSCSTSPVGWKQRPWAIRPVSPTATAPAAIAMLATWRWHCATSPASRSRARRGAPTARSALKAPCDDEGGKRNASYWSASRFFERLATLSPSDRRPLAAPSASSVRKLPTASYLSAFASDASRALLRSLASVVSGGSIYRKSSYLCGREGTQVASPLITIVDDPLRPRGPGSRAFRR